MKSVQAFISPNMVKHKHRMSRPRKIAESTGMFPPTPMLEIAARDASATNVKEPPIAIPNTPPMNNVRLNDHLR